MHVLVMKLRTHFEEARPLGNGLEFFFFFGQFVSFLGLNMGVTMRAVKYCQPSHPDPKTLHRAPDCLSNRSRWSSPHQEALSAFFLQRSIHLLWPAKQHLPSTFAGSQRSPRGFVAEKRFLVVLH